MNAFDITRTPICTDDNVKLIFVVQGGTYKGTALQGFICDNEHFPSLCMPFDAVYTDHVCYEVDEESEEYKFTKNQLNSMSDENIENLSWRQIEKLMNDGDLYINLRGKRRFVNLMAVHEKVYEMLMKEEIDSVMTYGATGSHLSRIKERYQKDLDFLLTGELSKEDKEDFNKELALLVNPTEKDIKALKNRYSFGYEMNLNSDMRFAIKPKNFKEIFKFFGNEKGLKLISEITFLSEVLMQNGYYFTPQTCCNETIDCAELSDFNNRLSTLQSEIAILRDEEKLPFKSNTFYVLKKSELMETIRDWGIEEKNITNEMEELSKKGIFQLKLDKNSENTLIELISQDFYNQDSILVQLILD